MTQCVVLLGGSYDPVHLGHVALAQLFIDLLQPDQLRVIPAGMPWQKNGLRASAQQRTDMAALAFAHLPLPVVVDRQEVERTSASYTIDTLRQLRAQFGPAVSLVLVIGADQLQRLDTWHGWHDLLDYAHIAVATRPGFALDGAGLPPAVAGAFTRRLGSLHQIRNTPHGLTYLAQDFAVDISATQIRAALQRGHSVDALVSPVVLDYIEQHNLYKS